MRSVADILHRTPWWALIFGALATFAALAVFVTPYHILDYRHEGRTDEESRAIKREIDNTFAENAINLGRGVIRGMLARTTDPQRRAELEEALEGLEAARAELREAGVEVLTAKRDALEAARAGVSRIRDAVANMREELDNAGAEKKRELQRELRELERSLRQAEREERSAARALERAGKGLKIEIGPAEAPAIEIQVDPDRVPPTPPGEIETPTPPTPKITLPPLPPEVATRIRRDVTSDMYRIGIGVAVILILVPLFIVAVVVKFFADRSRAAQKVAELKRREAEFHRMSQQVTEAKLSALQAQVEPHFLYNTLASVQALTEVDPARANEMTGHLINYLRNALPKMRESVSTVGQEIELARAYLSILRMRMGKRLDFEIDVPADLMDAPFPPLMLPSLVENAIKHGLEPQREGGMVRITASREGERLRLAVADTGRGFSETPGAGVGLANIRERLAALYGERARLALEANVPQGVVATIEVPAAGTRAAGASTAASRAAASEAPPSPRPPLAPAAGPAAFDAATPASARKGFWPRTWEVLVIMERAWRRVLWFVFLALVMLAGVAAIAGFVAIAVGVLPVQLGNDVVGQPLGLLIGLAGAIVGFVGMSAGLAITMLILYGVGFLVFAVLVFTAAVVVISLSPVLAPIALVGLGIWWLARRNKPPPPPPPRVEPTFADPGR